MADRINSTSSKAVAARSFHPGLKPNAPDSGRRLRNQAATGKEPTAAAASHAAPKKTRPAPDISNVKSAASEFEEPPAE